MGLPGFAAESALYRTSLHYKMGAVAIPPQPGAPALLPGQPLPAAPIGPFPNVLCQPCSLDQSGHCTQYCVFCPGPIPDPRCHVVIAPCTASECCPAGQSPCYVSGKKQHCCPGTCCDPLTNFCCPPERPVCCDPVKQVCCPPGQSCCFGVCCPAGTNCCGGICCPSGQCGCNGACCPTGQCCNGVCCPPGQCGCNGSCCPAGQCCNGVCCPPGQSCSNGICCPTGQVNCSNSCVDLSTDSQNCGSCASACGRGQNCVNGQCICATASDPSFCSPTGRKSSSNYFLANFDFQNNCQPITNLSVTLTATADINSSSGFTVQLNGDSQQGIDAWQQYVFSIVGNSIKGQINNWQNSTTAIVCDAVDVASTPISNGIPNGYSLQITLQYENVSGAVSGARFQVFSPQGKSLGDKTFLVSQATCNCNFPPGFQCTGYQSTADLSAITTFQLNIVGPGNSSAANFTSGAGNIVYAGPELTALSSPPACVEAAGNLCTAETSNATYGQLDACPHQSQTQTFNT